jgi:hypothetical protein
MAVDPSQVQAMVVDPFEICRDDLAVAIALDPTVEAIIPRRIDAMIAMQGWEGLTLSNQQNAYVAVLTTKALLPRVISEFLRKIQSMEAGPAKAEYVDAVEGLKLLQKELAEAVKQAAKNVDPGDAVEDVVPPAAYPTGGPVGF